MPASLDVHDGKATRKIARSWRRKTRSTEGLCVGGVSGKRFASAASCSGDVGLMLTFGYQETSVSYSTLSLAEVNTILTLEITSRWATSRVWLPSFSWT
jgi:hypothetical protein